VIEISDKFKNNIKKEYDNKKIRIIYDKYNYIDFYRVYNRIRISLYLYKLIKYFRTYIEYYLKYRIYQIFRHKFYEILKSIVSSFIPFYIICGDFVLELLITVNDINTTFIFIDKFTKRIKIILERAI
jgi:hypothetical protein